MDARPRLYDAYPKHLIRRGHDLDAPPSGTSRPIVRPWVPREADARVLELGCGSGGLLRQFRAGGLTDLTGVDSTQSQVDRAMAHEDGTRYVVQDAKEFLSANERLYDLVCAFDFIEHLTVDEALEVCDLVYRSLAQGGCLVLRTPNAASLLGDYGWHADLTHITQYTEYSLFQLLDAAGFCDHEVKESRRPRLGRSAFRHPVRWFLRPWTNYSLHRMAYWARAQQPPRSYEANIEVWTFKR